MEKIKLNNDIIKSMGKNHSKRLKKLLQFSPIHRTVSCLLACWELYVDIMDNDVEHFYIVDYVKYFDIVDNHSRLLTGYFSMKQAKNI